MEIGDGEGQLFWCITYDVHMVRNGTYGTYGITMQSVQIDLHSNIQCTIRCARREHH